MTAIQYDVAGNFSKPLTYGSPGAIVIDGTAADAPNSGDNLGPGGTNEGGWLYMQQVLQLIQPNVADGQKTLVALGPDPRLGLTTGAAAAIASAFAQSTLPGLGWSLDYVVGPSNINAFLNGQPAVAYGSNGQPISGEMLDSNGNLVSGGATLGQTGLLYIPTVDETADDMTDADLAVVNADGLQIANYVNGGGGLYAQAEAPSLATATATATATINSTSGAINTIAVTGGGAGYTTVPAVTLTGGGFTTPATATAVLDGRRGYRRSAFSGGSGYISAPTVTIAPPPAGITPWGWLTSIVPVAVLLPVNVGPNGVTPLNVKITAAGQTTFPTLQVANITTGPWQNYFTGVASPLSTVATEDSPSGTARSLILTAASVARQGEHDHDQYDAGGDASDAYSGGEQRHRRHSITTTSPGITTQRRNRRTRRSSTSAPRPPARPCHRTRSRPTPSCSCTARQSTRRHRPGRSGPSRCWSTW